MLRGKCEKACEVSGKRFAKLGGVKHMIRLFLQAFSDILRESFPHNLGGRGNCLGTSCYSRGASLSTIFCAEFLNNSWGAFVNHCGILGKALGISGKSRNQSWAHSFGHPCEILATALKGVGQIFEACYRKPSYASMYRKPRKTQGF